MKLPWATRGPLSYRLPLCVFKMVRSEKAQKLLEQQRTATFIVPLALNKPMVKDYLQKLYGLHVEHVSTVIVMGKKKRGIHVLSRGIRQHTEKLPDYKKAMVRLSPKDLVGFKDNFGEIE